jgi:hypothetical protein
MSILSSITWSAFVVSISICIMHESLGGHADLFSQKFMPTYEATDEDMPP